jgi:isocitrate dehydrogenase
VQGPQATTEKMSFHRLQGRQGHVPAHQAAPRRQKISVNADSSLNVPDQPVIPCIEGEGEGEGTGFDITPVILKAVGAAVARSYGGQRRIHGREVYAGKKSTRICGPDLRLPEETLATVKAYVMSIKGPLTTPVSGDIRSLNIAAPGTGPVRVPAADQ